MICHVLAEEVFLKKNPKMYRTAINLNVNKDEKLKSKVRLVDISASPWLATEVSLS